MNYRSTFFACFGRKFLTILRGELTEEEDSSGDEDTPLPQEKIKMFGIKQFKTKILCAIGEAEILHGHHMSTRRRHLFLEELKDAILN